MSPIPPPPVVTPYDTLITVLNVARTRLNDAISSLSGDILTDTQPFTGTMTNSAWRKMQALLANLGYSRLKQQFIGTAYPVVAPTDPASQTFLSWEYFFDGTSYYQPPDVNLLPFDFICPLRMWERWSGTGAYFQPMAMAPDGLPDWQKRPWNGWFEWREDAIYMPGSTAIMDLRIEYAAYLADFPVDPLTNVLVTPATQKVPIMRCQSSLANYLCAEMAQGRNDLDVQGFIAQAETDAKLVMNNEIKLKQRTPIQRRSYSGRNRGALYGNRGYF